MKESSRFFENRQCEYYPCHKGIKELNCLFCFCPLYNTDCPGNYSYKEKDGKLIKSCIDCCFPHIPDNYDRLMEYLKRE